jgi:2-polyprenyl-6-methoxyphenol hydroxylase-like FAD-dependent oxidoreductase
VSRADERYPESTALTGPGMMFALSDQRAIMTHGGADIHVGPALRVPEDWTSTSGIDWSNPAAVRDALVAEFADWSIPLTDLIRRADDTIVPRPIYALPAEHRWERVPGVTLVGDAAHVMAPFAGEGANLAMLDATELALALVEHGDDVESALARYETAMFPRAQEANEGSEMGLSMLFSPDSPRAIVEFFGSAPVAPARSE